MDVNKKNRIISSTIIVLLIAAIVGVVSYNRALMDKRPNNNISNNKDADDEIEENDEINTKQKVCVGKYYGEYKTYLNDGETSLDLKYTYILNSDNTYSANFVSSGNEGTYRIDGDAIIFKHVSETNGSNVVEDKYEIADDCSYILIDEPDSDVYNFKLNKQ